MSTSAQGVMLLNSHNQQPQVVNTSSMATSLQSMPGKYLPIIYALFHMSISKICLTCTGLLPHHPAVLSHHQQITNVNVSNSISLMQQSGLPDINSIQQGLPQPLRGAKSETRPCNMPYVKHPELFSSKNFQCTTKMFSGGTTEKLLGSEPNSCSNLAPTAYSSCEKAQIFPEIRRFAFVFKTKWNIIG